MTAILCKLFPKDDKKQKKIAFINVCVCFFLFLCGVVTLRKALRKFDLIKADNTISAKKIAEKLGISPRTAQYDIEKLKKEKRIAREGGDFGGHYVILK